MTTLNETVYLKDIIFINSHPIQYFAPFYAYLNRENIRTECWYCSEETVRGHYDRQFGTHVQWDIPVLDGYPHRFFKNYSWKPSLYNGFFGLMNFGMVSALFRQKKSVVIIHGWAYFTHLMILVMARLAGHTVCIRGESPLHQEMLKSRLNRFIKQIFFRGFLFRWIHQFLFIGTQNRMFYEYYGVRENRLRFVPYAVDNERFQLEAKKLGPDKGITRSQLGLPLDGYLILFAAKFIRKKRPLDLLSAFQQLNIPNKCLVMVGDGDLRKTLETFIGRFDLKNVYLPGFKNQSEISSYYASADVFVICSEAGETWGLTVNEALNFRLPVVASDMTGSSSDMIVPNKNGFVFKTGDVSDLVSKLEHAIELKPEMDILEKYSYKACAQALYQLAASR